MLSGQLYQFFVRPGELVADLKEKISLAQGIPIIEQRLVFMQNELHNQSSFRNCGVVAGSTLHLVLVASVLGPQATSYFTSVVNPALSISHFNLGLGLERLVTAPPSSSLHHPPKVPLPPHITHILHLYDIPSEGFKMFVQFLYSRELDAEGSSE